MTPAEEIPDSLITIFRTENGRDVIDGRGVEPDIETVEQRELSRSGGITIIKKQLSYSTMRLITITRIPTYCFRS